MADWAGRRSVPEALRRGLTFWRRSIQARVVVSTVLLSTVVVLAVGWFLLRQVQQGLLDHRVDDRPARGRRTRTRRPCDRLSAAPGIDTNANDQAAGVLFAPIFVSGQARGLQRRHARPRCPRRLARDARLGVHAPARPRQRAPVAGRPLRRRSADGDRATEREPSRGPTPRSRSVARTARPSARLRASSSGRRSCTSRPTARRGRVYYLFPLDDVAADPGPGDAAPCSPPESCCSLLIAALTWLVTRQVVTPIRMARAGGRAAGGRAAPGTAAGRPARTTWPAWRRRSTRWPPTCSARSGSSRS